MHIKNPERPSSPISKKLEKKYVLFEKLTAALNQHEIPEELAEQLNAEIKQLNAISDTAKEKPGKMAKVHARIIRKVLKELGLVPKNYHRNLWMGIGMAAFGVPMGVAFGLSLDNMAYLGIGLPLGLAVGLAVGIAMDEKAKKDGKQLDLDYEL